jgi:hypothetical protein
MKITLLIFKSAAMCLTVLISTALVAQGHESVAAKPTSVAEKILAGEKRNLQFGPYKWRVLEVKGDSALMITENVIEKRQYHRDYANVTWKTCDLRKYLNGPFLQKFSDDQQKQIAETTIKNKGNPEYGLKGGGDTEDKVFILNIEEARRYLRRDSDRKANNWWWLRGPGYNNNPVAEVTSDGSIDSDGNSAVNPQGGVRPVLWINLKPSDQLAKSEL